MISRSGCVVVGFEGGCWGRGRIIDLRRHVRSSRRVFQTSFCVFSFCLISTNRAFSISQINCMRFCHLEICTE